MVTFPSPSPLLPEAAAAASAASIRTRSEAGSARQLGRRQKAPREAAAGNAHPRAHVRPDCTSLMHLLCWVSAGRGHTRQPTWPPSTTRRPAHALKLPARGRRGGGERHIPAPTATAPSKVATPAHPTPVRGGPPAPPPPPPSRAATTAPPPCLQSPSSGLPAQTARGRAPPPTWRWIPPGAGISAHPPASASSCLRRPPRPRTASPPAASVPAAPWTGGGRGRAQGYTSLPAAAPATQYPAEARGPGRAPPGAGPGPPYLQVLQLPPAVLQLPPLAVNLRLPLALLLSGRTEGAQDPPRALPLRVLLLLQRAPTWPSACLCTRAAFYSTLPRFPHLHRGSRVHVLMMKGISVFSFAGTCQQALLSRTSPRLSVGNP